MENARRLILAIETSNPSAPGSAAGVALGRFAAGGAVEVLVVESLRDSPGEGEGAGRGRRGGLDDDLMPAIDRVFRSAGADRMQLARVGVSVGPGGYTGLRVACCAGKMLAEACGARCVAVPSARVVLEGVPEAVRARGPVAIALASKGDSAWVQVFEGGEERGPGRIMDSAAFAEIARSGVRTLVADHHLPPGIRGAASECGLSIIEPTFGAEACLGLTARLPAIDPAELVPLYAREPEAVSLWRRAGIRALRGADNGLPSVE